MKTKYLKRAKCLKKNTKRRKIRRVRRGGDVDARTGLPLLASDTMDFLSSSMISMKNTILGNYHS